MPDLVGSLAEQVRAFSDETLACALYQLAHPRPGLPSAIELVGTFTHRAGHTPHGTIHTTLYLNERVLQLPRVPVSFTYTCRSQAALRLMLEELMWEPTARYWLVVRHLPGSEPSPTHNDKDKGAGGSSSHSRDGASAGASTAAAAPWPPALRTPVPDPDFGFPPQQAGGYVSRHRLLHELAALFPTRAGHFVKILYQEEWEEHDNPVVWTGSYDTARGWCRRMGAACAEAVYSLLADG